MACTVIMTLFTAQLAGEARQLGCPKIVLDHMCVYNNIYLCMIVCMLRISSLLVVYDAIDSASSMRAMRTENYTTFALRIPLKQLK